MPEDAVQFVRGVLPSTVTVGSTYTLPPHNEPHVVLLIVDEGSCVVVHLAPLGSGCCPRGSAATVKKGMKWFASSASPVKLTDEERVRADAARERFAQREQRLEESRKQAERESREQAERERHAASQRQQEAQRARWHAEAHRKPWDNSFCWPWPNAGIAALVITILLLGFGFPVFKSQLSSHEICLSTSGDEICVVESSPLTTYRRGTELSFMREGSVGATIVGGLFAKQPELEQLVLEWVSIFYFGGAEYRPGHSWLQATYDGRQILAFLPEQSVFRYNGRLFALLQLYPTAERDEHGLTTSSISEGYQPEAIAVALNSPKLQSVTALWLSYREQRGLSTMYRFTTHGVCGSRPCTVYDRVAPLVILAALLAAGFLFCVRSLAKRVWFHQLPNDDPRRPENERSALDDLRGFRGLCSFLAFCVD